jgi:two-component system, OmpR family, phosphate regulon response regulator PhoB
MALDTTILLVEDEPAILDLLEFALVPKGYKLVRALNADEARQAIRNQLPDLVILDWMMPGESGVQLARALRADPRTRPLPIIMLTAKAEEGDKIAGLDAGADDYVTKPFSPRELISRINALLRRRAPEHAEEPLVFGSLSVDPGKHEVRVGSKMVDMGATEFRLLRFFVAHPERVYSRAQLLDQVWGDHSFIEERTVDVHILRLRKALAPFGAEELVQTVRGAGYRLAKS